MRIVCISDTHGLYDSIAPDSIPDGDVLIHAGDMTNRGELWEFERVNAWMRQLRHTHKLVIAGNHDWGLELDSERAEALLESVTYLRDSHTVIDGVKFYGSPWQPEFCDWAFNMPRGRLLASKWQGIPPDTDVLITHGPPWGKLDRAGRFGRSAQHVGCQDLSARVNTVRPALHVFGHIHEDRGTEIRDGITYANAAICTRKYRPTNPPIVVDLDPITKKVEIISCGWRSHHV